MAQLAYLAEDDARFDVAVPADVLAPTVSLYGDPSALTQLAQDARGAGLIVRGARPLESLLGGSGGVLGDVVIVECREIGGAQLAALVRLDERAARSGAQVIVLTSRAALEDVFACCDSAPAQILVEATAAERVLALGAALMRLSRSRVREMDEGDRIVLLRLTEEVGRLAAKLDGLVPLPGAERSGAMGNRLGSPGRDFRGEERDYMMRPRVSLPDARVIHRIIRQRRMRDRFFDSELFADPAWDILLDLTAARAEHRRVSVTSLCIAAAVPSTTALRWIAQMTDAGILVREQDEEDRRRAFVALSDTAAEAMARYFEELGKDGTKLS
ncbi:MAG TPA: winged helix DNA-binding protein [Qipengyuania sp.]|nr:winged helix DNA-binding protein [Qipengyuania sp.]